MWRWASVAASLVYPRVCGGCGEQLDPEESHLCWDCRADIQPVVHPFCSICGNPFEGRIDHQFVCWHCKEETPHFDRARCAARYRGVLPQLIRGLKYNAWFWMIPDLGDLLEASYRTHFAGDPPDFIASVPLFHRRRRFRTYNQSTVLARDLARRTKIPFRRFTLLRLRDTQTQTHLTAPERASNVRHAFWVPMQSVVAGRRILLIDDVMTTGATVNECARALKLAGAAKVLVLTLARGG